MVEDESLGDDCRVQEETNDEVVEGMGIEADEMWIPKRHKSGLVVTENSGNNTDRSIENEILGSEAPKLMNSMS